MSDKSKCEHGYTEPDSNCPECPNPKAQSELSATLCSAKCSTCKFFDRAFPQNRQLGYCKGIQIQRLDGGGIAISRRIYAWLPGDEALRLLDDFGCAYHSPNDPELSHACRKAGVDKPKDNQ